MKQRLFTLFTLVLCAFAGVWAEDVTISWTDMATESHNATKVGVSTSTNITPDGGVTTLNANGKKSGITGGTLDTYYRYGGTGFPKEKDETMYFLYTFSVADGYEFTASNVTVEWAPSGSRGIKFDVYATEDGSTYTKLGSASATADKAYTTSTFTPNTKVKGIKLYPYGKADNNIILNTLTISGTLEATGTQLTQLKAPSISYTKTGEVTITPANSTDKIMYTTDGTTPSANNGMEYTAPFTVSNGTTVNAIAIGDGTTTENSEIASMYVLLSIESPVISSFNGTVGITCATDGATLEYSTDGTTYTTYARAFTLTEDATVYAKASYEGWDDVITTKSVSVVPENSKTKTIYMGWGSFTMTTNSESSTGHAILTGNSGDDAEGYSIELTGKTGKDYQSMSSITISDSVSRTAIKVSNGAQNTLYLPEGVKATKLTLYSVMNYDRVANGSEGRVCSWKEINNVKEEADNIPLGAYIDLSDEYKNPDVRVYPLDNVTGSITFTNAGEQLGFVIALDVIEDETRDMVIVPIGSDGVATYSSDKALDFSSVTDEITPYVATSYDGATVNLTAKADKLPASTGIIVKSANGKAYRASVPVLSADETATVVDANLLVATVEETAVAASTTGAYNYIFGKKADEIGFWKVGDGGATSAAGKAYLQTTDDLLANGAKGVSLNFSEGIVTGINNVSATPKANGIFYTLSGVRVSNPQKGLYIQNGKKVIIK